MNSQIGGISSTSQCIVNPSKEINNFVLSNSNFLHLTLRQLFQNHHHLWMWWNLLFFLLQTHDAGWRRIYGVQKPADLTKTNQAKWNFSWDVANFPHKMSLFAFYFAANILCLNLHWVVVIARSQLGMFSKQGLLLTEAQGHLAVLRYFLIQVATGSCCLPRNPLAGSNSNLSVLVWTMLQSAVFLPYICLQ